MEQTSAYWRDLRSQIASGPDDRREHARLICRGVAELRFVELKLRITGTLMDLSLGGCCVNCDRELPQPAGSLVEVYLTVNGNRLCVGGVVRNTRRHETRAGIEFHKVTDRKADQIRQMIKDLMEQKAFALQSSQAS